MVNYHQKLKKEQTKFIKKWHIISEVVDKTDALLFQHQKCSKTTKECAYRQAELWKLRNKITKTILSADKILGSCQSNVSKQDALMTHLVSLIKDVDTGKGRESTNKK